MVCVYIYSQGGVQYGVYRGFESDCYDTGCSDPLLANSMCPGGAVERQCGNDTGNQCMMTSRGIDEDAGPLLDICSCAAESKPVIPCPHQSAFREMGLQG